MISQCLFVDVFDSVAENTLKSQKGHLCRGQYCEVLLSQRAESKIEVAYCKVTSKISSDPTIQKRWTAFSATKVAEIRRL